MERIVNTMDKKSKRAAWKSKDYTIKMPSLQKSHESHQAQNSPVEKTVQMLCMTSQTMTEPVKEIMKETDHSKKWGVKILKIWILGKFKSQWTPHLGN